MWKQSEEKGISRKVNRSILPPDVRLVDQNKPLPPGISKIIDSIMEQLTNLDDPPDDKITK